MSAHTKQSLTAMYRLIHQCACIHVHCHTCVHSFKTLWLTQTHTRINLSILCEEFINVLIRNIWNHSSQMYHRLFRFDIWTAWDWFQEWSGHLDVKGAKCVSFTGFYAADVRSGELRFIFLYDISPHTPDLYPHFNRLLRWGKRYLTLDLSLCLCNGLEA